MSSFSRVNGSSGAVYARLEDLRCRWLQTHRLVARRVLKQCRLLGHWLAVATRLKTVPSIGLPTRRSTRLKTVLPIEILARRSTRIKKVPCIGLRARRSTRLKAVPFIGRPARRAKGLIFQWKRVLPTLGQTELLALLVEPSSIYSSRGSTAGIIQPTQGLIERVYALIGLKKSALYLFISFLLGGANLWLPFILGSPIQIHSEKKPSGSSTFDESLGRRS